MMNMSYIHVDAFAVRCAIGVLLLSGACSGGGEGSPPLDRCGKPAGATIEGAQICFEAPIPNIMLLVDRSGSMAGPACGPDGCPSRWGQLLRLGPHLGLVKDRARFGLAVFPAPMGGACEVGGGILVPLTDAPDLDTRILTALEATLPGGNTPTAAALREVVAYGGLDAPDRDNVVVLFTDGGPNCVCGASVTNDCEADAAVAAVQAIVDRDPPVKLFIVGFGVNDQGAQVLTRMADAAAAAFEDPPDYFQADTIEQLVGRLGQVVAGTQPCTFRLDQPAEPDLLVVAIDGVRVPRCGPGCDNGYEYDPVTHVVVLRGTACASLRDGMPHDLVFAEQSTPGDGTGE